MDGLLDGMAKARLVTTASPFVCGIVNVKNGFCSEDCAFCAQSARHVGNLNAAPDTKPNGEEILRRAESMAEAGFAYMGLVASGLRPTPQELAQYCALVTHMVSRVNIRFCASFGMLSSEEAICIKQAGFTSYHHNLETSRSFFSRICTTHEYDRRVETVRNARAAGLRVCSGGIFGLGESWTDRDELAATLVEIDVDSIPVNFLTPIPGTPMADRTPLSPAEALEIIARLRRAMPDKDIVIAGGRPTTLGEFDRLIFSAGANGLMSGDYLTTPGMSPSRDFTLFTALGLTPCRR